MNIKNKEPIQAALDSLEMALEHLEDQEEYTLNDVSIKDLWDIWEEASHQLGMSDDKGDQAKNGSLKPQNWRSMKLGRAEATQSSLETHTGSPLQF